MDEEGTEAAAVTAVLVLCCAVPREMPERLRFDRPFLFFIIDDVSGTLLFMGCVHDPSTSEHDPRAS